MALDAELDKLTPEQLGMSVTLAEIKAARAALRAAMAKNDDCDVCKAIVGFVFSKVLGTGTCVVIGGNMAGVFVLAGIIFAEVEPLEELVPKRTPRNSSSRKN